MANKFLKNDTKLLGLIDQATQSEIKRRNFRFDHEVYHTKHLTECPRRLMYRVMAHEVDQVDHVPEFLNDNHLEYVKRKWVDFFSECKYTSVLGRDVLAADCNYNIVGSADVILKIGDFTSILIVDSLDTKSYQKSKNTGGLRRHVVDIMTVMWLVEVENGILFCENKATNEYFMSHIIPYQPIIDSVLNKCKNLVEKRILQKMPDRVYKSHDNNECKLCKYRSTCWRKKGEEHAQEADK